MLPLMVASCQSSTPDGRAHGYDEMYLSVVQQKAKDLNQAFWRGDKEAVTAFLARGSSPNERDSMGMTPLMNATIAYGIIQQCAYSSLSSCSVLGLGSIPRMRTERRL